MAEIIVNPGDDVSTAFFNAASADAFGGGDTIIFEDGDHGGGYFLNKSGVTLRARNPGAARIHDAFENNGLKVTANYVTIEGLVFEDNDLDGLAVEDSHHIIIRDVESNRNGESGIQFDRFDLVMVDGYRGAENSSAGWFSALSLYQPYDMHSDTEIEAGSGHAIIIRNIVGHGQYYLETVPDALRTDSNCLLIDDGVIGQAWNGPGDRPPPYTKSILVDNGLAYDNFGLGFGVYVTEAPCTMRNLTSWHNQQASTIDRTWRNELSISQSQNATWENCIAIADTDFVPSGNPSARNTAYGNNAFGGYTNTGCTWTNCYGSGGFNNNDGQATPVFTELPADELLADPAAGDFTSLIDGVGWVDPKATSGGVSGGETGSGGGGTGTGSGGGSGSEGGGTVAVGDWYHIFQYDDGTWERVAWGGGAARVAPAKAGAHRQYAARLDYYSEADAGSGGGSGGGGAVAGPPTLVSAEAVSPTRIKLVWNEPVKASTSSNGRLRNPDGTPFSGLFYPSEVVFTGGKECQVDVDTAMVSGDNYIVNLNGGFVLDVDEDNRSLEVVPADAIGFTASF